MKKRIFSRVLALFMALAMLSTTALADVSFDDLQEAIDGTETEKTATEVVADAVPADKMPEASEPDTSDAGADPAEPTETTEPEDKTHVNGALVRQETLEDGTTQNYFGYGWSQDTQSNWYYAIEAHDAEGNRYVVLLDDVSKGNGEASGVVIGQDGSKTDVTIDMNGHSITGEKDSAVITVNKDAELNLNNGTISGGQIGIDVLGTLILDNVTVASNGTGIKLNKDGKLTFKENNKFTDNDADVELTVNGKTYKVDADTAEALMETPVATGTDWLLVKGKDDSYIVAYTGTGDKTNQLTQAIVRTVLNDAGTDGKIVTGFAIPEGVTKIGVSAFNSHTNLKTINIPDSVTSIETFAFNGCSSLESIIIPRSVTSLATNKVFYGCSSLKRVEILGSVAVPSYCFDGLSSLQSVKISEQVTGINDYAFRNCSALTTIEWPQSGALKEIRTMAFGGCTGLTGELVIPEGVNTIYPRAFEGCTGLKKVTIPATVTQVWGNAFNGCSGIKSFWVYPKDGQTATAVTAAFNQYYNVFVVTDDVQLYRYGGNVITFYGLAEDNLTVSEDDGGVTINASANSTMSIVKDNVTTTITFSEDGAVMTMSAGGKLTIPDLEKDVAVTVTDASGNQAEWKLRGGITKTWGMPEISGGSTITASDGTSITSFSSALIGKDGYKVTEIITKGNPTTLTDKDGNTVALTSGNGEVKIAIDGTVTLPGNSSVDSGDGFKTSYSCGATIKGGQITSGYDVAVDNGAGGRTIVKPAKVDDPVTVDPINGTITVPSGGSVTMNDGKNVVSYPDGATVDRQGSAASNSNVVEYAYEKSSGTVTTPEGSTIKVGSDGTIAVPEGSTIAGVEYPYGATILPDGIIVANLAPFVVLPDFTFDSDTAGTGDGDDTTTIDDEAIPLAGLISRAQLVSYLYAHEGSPDGEDAEDEYALAWVWGVENEIVDEGDDPEEIVTVAILREIMTAYAKFLDTTFDVVIEEDDDMPVMNCDEILAEFYASLEDKAA